jgi:ABC-2 type transport system ATP-binding protein
MNMLEAKALQKRYADVIALESLDLTIAASEVYCLLGTNGTGKTMLMVTSTS